MIVSVSLLLLSSWLIHVPITMRLWNCWLPEEHFVCWYVSNVSIIFDCSMLYYLLFWTLLSFIIHFYIIFGTKLLTGGPTQNCCFLPILGFRRKGISNEVQTEWNLREWTRPRRLGPYVKQPTGKPRGRGARLTPQAHPPAWRAPCFSTEVLLPPIYTYVPPNDQI